MSANPFGGFSMFSLFNLMFPLVFIMVFGIILFTLIRGIREWSHNNRQPVLSVEAEITSKRTHVSRHVHHHNNHPHHSSSTSYYATFEVESGDRMELHVSSHEYGQLAEGDTGKLTFQGTRYLGFERYKDSSQSF